MEIKYSLDDFKEVKSDHGKHYTNTKSLIIFNRLYEYGILSISFYKSSISVYIETLTNIMDSLNINYDKSVLKYHSEVVTKYFDENNDNILLLKYMDIINEHIIWLGKYCEKHFVEYYSKNFENKNENGGGFTGINFQNLVKL